jgi:hypothetical protein
MQLVHGTYYCIKGQRLRKCTATCALVSMQDCVHLLEKEQLHERQELRTHARNDPGPNARMHLNNCSEWFEK